MITLNKIHMKKQLLLVAIMMGLLTQLSAQKERLEFSGDIYVGSGHTYTNLTQTTAGLFDAINNGSVTGNITVYITSDLVETGSNGLNEFASPYTIEIKPDQPVSRIITGHTLSSRGLIRLVGADRVTIDGSYGGSGQYLTINNYLWRDNVIAIQFTSQGEGLGCESNTIKNCIIITGRNDSNSYGIHLGGLNAGNSGPDNDNNSFLNNTIDNAYFGIFSSGTSSGVLDNIEISGNTFGSSASSIGNTAIYLKYANNANISNNQISNYTLTSDQKTGIYLATGVVNSQVSHNSFSSIKGSGLVARGIQVNTGNASSNITIDNNLIYDIGSPGSVTINSEGNTGVGIYGNTGGISLYFNAINLYGSCNRAQPTISSALYLASTTTGITLNNNLLSNSIVNNSNSSAKSYAIYNAGSNAVFTDIDYNDYFASGTQGVLGYLSTDKSNLSDWQSASGQDVHSLAADINYRAPDNLQPIVGSPVLNAGIPITGITTDFTGLARDAVHPSMGAYEEGYVVPAVDWCNLQSPSVSIVNEGVGITVYAQVFEDYITTTQGQGEGIQCWIGWNTSNTNPDTWSFNTWYEATYNTDVGNNDEYMADNPGYFGAGTYYFASRFLITDGVYQYGGWHVSGGGFWDGTQNVSGILTIEDNTIDWANIQYPESISIEAGETADIYARYHANGVTTLETPSAGVNCEIGWSPDNTDPSTWTNWEYANFNLKSGNNHEYMVSIGSNFEPGTYYYASRFELCQDGYVYGGYSTDGGGIWDGITYQSGVLTVNPLIVNLPYTEDFDGANPPYPPAGWTVIDNNSDDITWESSSGIMMVSYNDTEAMDDWLFSPGMNLSAGVTYSLVFFYGAYSEDYPEKLEVKFGTTATVAGMTSVAILSDVNITSWKEASCEITPQATGTYYIGWHGFSDADMYDLLIDDVEVVMVNSWTGLVDNFWSTPGNWLTGEVPTSSTIVTINSPANVIVDLPHAVCGRLTINAGGKVTINPNMGLEAYIINNAGEAGLLVLSDASGTGQVLCNGGVPMVFQRFIQGADWSDPTSGWHFLSSPLTNQLVSGDWTPTAADDDYDFYSWDGNAVTWLNQKVPENGLTDFEQGIGYKVAYQMTRSHVFSGVSSDNGLAFSRWINANSWLMFGNPFPCAIKWMHQRSDWTMDGIQDIAKIWNSENKSYSDLYPNDIIPATNGFLVFGEGIFTSVTVQMSIPPSARTIDATPFYKSTDNLGVFLEVRETDRGSAQESNLMLNENASENYNPLCDSRFQEGYAPLFYSIKGTDKLSTYGLSSFDTGTEIVFGFEKNDDEEFQLVLNKERSISYEQIILKDLKTGNIHNLSVDPTYSFLSSIVDDPNRFILHIGALGIDDSKIPKTNIYAYGKEIYIDGVGAALVEVFTLNGQKLFSRSMMLNGRTSLGFNGNGVDACYMIRLIDKEEVMSRKVILR